MIIAGIDKDMAASVHDRNSGKQVSTGTIYAVIRLESNDADDGKFWDGSAWEPTILWTDPVGLARVAVGDCDPDNGGKEIVVGSDSGKVYLIKGSGKNWDAIELFTDTDKNRGVWIGDVDPFHPGNEIAV